MGNLSFVLVSYASLILIFATSSALTAARWFLLGEVNLFGVAFRDGPPLPHALVLGCDQLTLFFGSKGSTPATERCLEERS